MKHFKSGFTLVELLIVITIIALLSGVVIGYVSDAGKKGRDSKRMQNIDQLAKAINLYFSQDGSLPTGTTGWCTYISNPDGPAPGYNKQFANDIAPYIANVPLDPTKAGMVGDYLFDNMDNVKGSYALCANLENPTGKTYDYTSCTGGAVYNYCITQ